jgi:hypothetical protein
MAVGLITFVSVISILFTLAKRFIMKDFGAITLSQATSIQFWIHFFMNPYIIIILVFNLGMFALNMWVFSFVTVNSVNILTTAVGIPAFLLTIFLARIALGEQILPDQYKGLILIIISTVLAFIGTYYYFAAKGAIV